MKQDWLVLSHGFNMDGRAASQTITDKIPHLLSRGIKPIVLSAVTGRRDEFVEHHQLLPVSPAGLRFDLRYILRRHLTSKLAYKLAVGLMTLLMLPFYALEKLFVRLEPQWSWFITAYFAGLTHLVLLFFGARGRFAQVANDGFYNICISSHNGKELDC